MSVTTSIQATEVNLSGLMEVLGKHLYSTPLVAIRELIQNAHDSCVRRRLEGTDDFTPEIRLRPNLAAGTLTFEDRGAGLTREEVVRYLATIGSGYTRQLRNEMDDDSLIGYFGLGFLSAYIVSKRVTVFTCSYQTPDQTWCYDTRDGQRYTLSPADPQPVGTRVILQLSEEFLDLADEELLESVLARYCCLLDLPVYLGDDEEPVNDLPPPWSLDPEEHTELRLRKLRLEFASLFELYFEPLCTLPLLSEDDSLDGLLWIQDSGSYATSDCRNLAVFVRGMSVAENERDLLPTWAGFAGGVLASSTLQPTASREDLQRDEAYDEALEVTTITLSRGLAKIAREEPETWRVIQRRHNEALLGAAVSDSELFDALADLLTLPTTEGDLRVPEILERTGGTLYLVGIDAGPEEMLFRALGEPVIQGYRFGAAVFARRHEERGAKVVNLGTSDGNEELFPAAEVEASMQARLEDLFAIPKVGIVASRYQPESLPLVLVPDRDAELKEVLESDKADLRISRAALGLARLFTAEIDGEVQARLFVNLDCPLIERLCGEPDAAARPAAEILLANTELSSRRRAGGRDDVVGPLVRLTASVTSLLDLRRPAEEN